MANRFLDTNYYKSPYVRGLKGSLKSLYSFIICDCNGAGIWNYDLQAASMYIGFDITEREFNEFFVEKGKAISVGGNKYFFPDFIEHQYPSGLQEQNKAHKNFIKILKKYDLMNDDFTIKKNLILEDPLKELNRGTGLLLGNGNGLGNGNRGIVIYNAEDEIKKNQIEFERICISTYKTQEQGYESLRKYHLHLEEKELYPKTKKSIFAGFEKWLLNEKKNFNGKSNTQQVGRAIEFDKP